MGVIADKIRRAIFGGEVRESIADGIEVVEQLREDYDNQVINAGNSNAEIVDARGGQTKLKDRLDNFDEQLDTFAKKGDVAKISSGTPVFASSVSEMTDTTKNYVNITDGYLYTYNGNEFENSNVKYQEMGLSNNQVSLMNLSQFIQSNYSLREWAIHYNDLKKGKYMYKYNNTIMEGTLDGLAYKKILVDDYDLVKINCNTGGSNIVSVFAMDSNNQIIYNSNTNYSGTFDLDVSKCSYIIINSYGTSIKNCSVTPYTLKYEKTSLDNYLKLTSNELEKTATVNYYFQYDNKYDNNYSNVYDVKNLEKVKLKGNFNEYMNYITLFDDKGDIVSYNIGLKGINEIEINVNNADYLLVSTSENLMSSIKILTYDIIENETIKFNMLDEYTCVVDSEFIIEYENIINYYDKSKYYFQYGMPNWSTMANKSNEDRLRILPTTNDIGKRKMFIWLKDRKTDKLIQEKIFYINVIQKKDLSDIKAIAIGDSLTNLGYYLKELKLLGNITLYGLRESQGIKHEGRPSWTTEHYINNQTYNGMSNPFYNPSTRKFDFSYYINNNNPFSDVNTIFLWLGRNDKYIDNVNYINNMNYIINSIKSYNSNISIYVFSACHRGNTYSSYATYKELVYKTNEEIINKLIDTNNKIYYVPIDIVTNNYIDFPRSTRNLTNRNTTTYEYITDDNHFNEEGMYKICDSCFFQLNREHE